MTLSDVAIGTVGPVDVTMLATECILGGKTTAPLLSYDSGPAWSADSLVKSFYAVKYSRNGSRIAEVEWVSSGGRAVGAIGLVVCWFGVLCCDCELAVYGFCAWFGCCYSVESELGCCDA